MKKVKCELLNNNAIKKVYWSNDKRISEKALIQLNLKLKDLILESIERANKENKKQVLERHI
jgi:hypothetical protein